MIFLSLMKTYCSSWTKEAWSQINRCIHESSSSSSTRYSLNDREERKRPSVGLSLKIISRSLCPLTGWETSKPIKIPLSQWRKWDGSHTTGSFRVGEGLNENGGWRDERGQVEEGKGRRGTAKARSRFR